MAFRYLYQRAEADGLITAAQNPAQKVKKPRRLASIRYWRLHPNGVLALLQIAGLVHDQHRVQLPEVIGDEPAQIRGHTVGVPDRPVEQVLHPVRRASARVLGDAPTRLTRQLREQPAHEPGEMLSGLHPREPAGDPSRSWPSNTGHKTASTLWPAATA
jgi:hypothetical protein